MLHLGLQTHTRNRCAFINPNVIQATQIVANSEHTVTYLVDAMRCHPNKLFFLAPYWQGY